MLEGESSGDRRLEEVNRTNQARVLVEELLCQVRAWRPDPLPQQDDITLVVVDVG